MTADTSEKGLEALIVRTMTGRVDLLSSPHTPSGTDAPVAGGTGWLLGDAAHYDREHCVDLVQLRGFLLATQPDLAEAFALDTDGATRQKFLARLQGEITRRGVIDVLRKGIKHGPLSFDLFYGTPSADNAKAVVRHAANRFSITRQLHYSREQTQRALDLCAFINGLPLITFELKNSLTKQTVDDAVEQYKRDRDPRETLFAFGRCVVHFAVDDSEVRMCTALKGAKGMAKDSWFLPFNPGWNDGAGNPPNPDGLKTDYLWKRILTPARLTDILENYAQIVEEGTRRPEEEAQANLPPLPPARRGAPRPRRRSEHGAGKRYLIQHSAGSGKSNSIAWLAHQLIGLRKDGGRGVRLDHCRHRPPRARPANPSDTIKGFAQVGSIIGAVKEGAGSSKTEQLAKFLKDGKKIIITTVQKFPFVLDRDRRGEHGKAASRSSSTKRTPARAAAPRRRCRMGGLEDGRKGEQARAGGRGDHRGQDQPASSRSRKLLKNASYFAFTATPKNKTLEMFGDRICRGVGDEPKHRPFHGYTMKQAIEEGFILDVLAHYTPVESYYRLAKTVAGDPEFDVKKARKKLRRLRRGPRQGDPRQGRDHDRPLPRTGDWRQKKIGGQARAMVVTQRHRAAIEYFFGFATTSRNSRARIKAIVAFSGELREVQRREEGQTEADLNGFPEQTTSRSRFKRRTRTAS
jgi:type I restriction enzyme R subunit